MPGVGLGVRHGVIGDGDPEDVVADAAGVVEHGDVQGLGFEDDEGGPLAQHGREPAVAAFFRDDVRKARALECQPQHRPDARIILDDDDLVHVRRILWHFFVRFG